MAKKKIYKKGTTVWLCCATHDPQSKEYEEHLLTEDATEDELEEIAAEYFWNTKEPSWWFQTENPEDD